MAFFGFLPYKFSDEGILHIYYFTRLGFFMHVTFRMFAVFEAACPILKSDVHHFSAVGDWLFSIFGRPFLYGGRLLHPQVEDASCHVEGDTL
jgi:hypothetical protein